MAKSKDLILRGSVYYSRIHVPERLRVRFGRSQIWKSLNTSDPAEAEARHLREAAHWKAAYIEAERGPPRHAAIR